MRQAQSGVRMVLVLLLRQEPASGVHDDEPCTDKEDEDDDHAGDNNFEKVGVFTATAKAPCGWIRHISYDAGRGPG